MKDEAERRNDHLRREIDLLSHDKNFLQRENSSLNDQVSRLQDKLDRAEAGLLESKKQADKYMDRVLHANDEIKHKFDDKYAKELQEMKDRYNKDLELVKSNLIEVYQTKTLHLTERKDELELRNAKLEK